MPALTVLLVGPELRVSLVPSVFPQTGGLVIGALVGLDNLVHHVIEHLHGLFGRKVLCGIVGVERQSHEDAVEPHLIGIDGLVPVDPLFGARLVHKLLEKCLQGFLITLPGSNILHTQNEFGRADIVEVKVLVDIPDHIALVIDHRLGIFLEIVDNAVAAIAEVGVEHTFQFNALSTHRQTCSYSH